MLVFVMCGWCLFELICVGLIWMFYGVRFKYCYGEEFGGFGGYDGRWVRRKGCCRIFRDDVIYIVG